jgi:hypothetical protein
MNHRKGMAIKLPKRRKISIDMMVAKRSEGI